MSTEPRLKLEIDLPVLSEYQRDVLVRLNHVKPEPLGWENLVPNNESKCCSWLNTLVVAGLVVQHPSISGEPIFSISYVGEQVLAHLRRTEYRAAGV